MQTVGVQFTTDYIDGRELISNIGKLPGPDWDASHISHPMDCASVYATCDVTAQMASGS